MARNAKPDLILLDMRLPDADGLDVLAQRQREPHLAANPVLVLSASAMPAEVQRALEAGARGFHPKPLTVAPLMTEVAEVLHAQRAKELVLS